MRKLTAENFNTPATAEEKAEALATMKRQMHVSRHVLETWDAQNPYVLTLGKLYGLTSTTLGWGTGEYAQSLGVTVAHPKTGGDCVTRRAQPVNSALDRL